MTRTTRATRFNLSEIMSNAHKLFKSQSEPGTGLRGERKTFSECLCQAWRAAKSYIGRSISVRWSWGMPSVCMQESAAYAAGVAAYYANARCGQYMGD